MRLPQDNSYRAVRCTFIFGYATKRNVIFRFQRVSLTAILLKRTNFIKNPIISRMLVTLQPDGVCEPIFFMFGPVFYFWNNFGQCRSGLQNRNFYAWFLI